MNFESLRNTRQFNFVYKRGKSIVNRYVVMYFVKNDLESNRIGFSVSKKVGKAVVRNKVKRLIKESVRLNSENVKIGYDIVFVARVRLNNSNFNEVERAVKQCFKNAKLLK